MTRKICGMAERLRWACCGARGISGWKFNAVASPRSPNRPNIQAPLDGHSAPGLRQMWSPEYRKAPVPASHIGCLGQNSHFGNKPAPTNAKIHASTLLRIAEL